MKNLHADPRWLMREQTPKVGLGLRTCLRCGHVECPHCHASGYGWCDRVDDGDLCCDGECRFAASPYPRPDDTPRGFRCGPVAPRGTTGRSFWACGDGPRNVRPPGDGSPWLVKAGHPDHPWLHERWFTHTYEVVRAPGVFLRGKTISGCGSGSCGSGARDTAVVGQYETGSRVFIGSQVGLSSIVFFDVVARPFLMLPPSESRYIEVARWDAPT